MDAEKKVADIDLAESNIELIARLKAEFAAKMKAQEGPTQTTGRKPKQRAPSKQIYIHHQIVSCGNRAKGSVNW